jgi:hypothetical protein
MFGPFEKGLVVEVGVDGQRRFRKRSTGVKASVNGAETGAKLIADLMSDRADGGEGLM